MRLHFVKSAHLARDYPEANLPEVALAGRSNAGKSSFLNTLAQQRLAFVSQQPGKTVLLNFFEASGKLRIVDMPGYGFAARSKKQQQEWQSMVETYLVERTSLTGLILVMDIRREWSEDEQMIFDFVASAKKEFAVVLTKIDKLGQNAWKNRLAQFERQFPEISFFPVSSLKKRGVEEVKKHILSCWVV